LKKSLRIPAWLSIVVALSIVGWSSPATRAALAAPAISTATAPTFHHVGPLRPAWHGYMPHAQWYRPASPRLRPVDRLLLGAREAGSVLRHTSPARMLARAVSTPSRHVSQYPPPGAASPAFALSTLPTDLLSGLVPQSAAVPARATGHHVARAQRARRRQGMFHRKASFSSTSGGWNLVAIPTNPSTPYTSQTLIDEINSQNGAGTITQLAIYQNGKPTPYVPGYGTPFPLTPGEGIFLFATKAYSWTPSGAAPSTGLNLSLNVGWNLVSAPYPQGYSASSMLKQINDEGGHATQLAVYVNGAYQTYVAGYSTDFQVSSGQGV